MGSSERIIATREHALNLIFEKLLIVLVPLLVGFVSGWTLNGWRADARIANLQANAATHDRKAAEELAKAERANTARLQQAMVAADAAIALAQSRQHNAEQSAKEKQREIDRLARSSACLSIDVVRVLNDTAAPAGGVTGLRLSVHPASTLGAAAAAAAHPGDGKVATEHDVATWIAQAQQQYATCTARLDAIRKWEQQRAPQ